MPSGKFIFSNGQRVRVKGVQRSATLATEKPTQFQTSRDSGMMSDLNDEERRTGPQNISVILPDESKKYLTVDADTPMRDVLVTVSKKFKLKPAEVRMELRDDMLGRVLDYNANQTIGSLNVDTLYMVNKISPRAEREKTLKKYKEASQFEVTQRVVVTIGKSSNKHTFRLNTQVPIVDIYKRICVEKNLDISKYEVKLTKTPKIPVDMSFSLDDYNTRDISLVLCSAPDFHTSMVDISQRNSISKDMTDNKMSEKVKKKKGLLGLFSRTKKSKRQEESRSISVQALLASDNSIINKPRAQVKPQAQVQPTIREEVEDESNMKVKKVQSNKKKKAPAPPGPRPVSMMAAIPELDKTNMYSSTPNLISSRTDTSSSTVHTDNIKPSTVTTKSRRQPIELYNHSRNSSDSSGYHEQLSPNSSPSDSSTLPRNKTQKSSIIDKPRPQSAIVQRSQTLPSNSGGGAKKTKKKAPPPPKLIEAPLNQAAPTVPSFVYESIIESEGETESISSRDDDTSIHGPMLGVVTPSHKGPPPPIFIPPPPPESPPPDMSHSPTSLRQELSKTPTSTDEQVFVRSESRCSQTSVNTIDDIQLSFNMAIAAGEEGLRDTLDGGVPRPDSVTSRHESRITDQADALTEGSQKTAIQSRKFEPSQDEINAAVAQLDFNLESGNTSPTASADSSPLISDVNVTDSHGSIRSNVSLNSTQRQSVKPVEEISYGFENPFRGQVEPIIDVPSDIPHDIATRRDSEISDSTLPDSELTDRPQSISLQSSVLQSDEDVTETGDGYDTTGTEKALSQSETEIEVKLRRQAERVNSGQGSCLEDLNKKIHGNGETGSVRGVPGQVREHSASFDKGANAARPATVYGLLQMPHISSDAPKRRSMYSVIQQEASTIKPDKRTPSTIKPDKRTPSTIKPDKQTPSTIKPDKQTLVINKPIHPIELNSKSQSLSHNSNTGAKMNSNASTKPLPVYKRTNNKTPEDARPLASLITESVTSGESNKTMRKTPDTTPQTMFFSARRVSSTNTSKTVIENRVKLDPKYETVQTKKNSEVEKPESSPVIKLDSVDKPVSSSNKELKRKESLKEQYKKMQSNMAMWQNKLQENENKVKTLTASQQNLSMNGKGFNRVSETASDRLSGSASNSVSRSVVNAAPGSASSSVSRTASSRVSGSVKVVEKSNGMVKSSTTNDLKSKTLNESNHSQSMPSELHQVTLRSAARRVIEKPPPELGVVDLLMQSIRERGGRTSEDAPDRGIYVATGDLESVSNDVTVREVAPSVLDKSVPDPPPVKISPHKTTTGRTRTTNNNNYRKSTGSADKSNDSRFKQQVDPRENLLDEIKNRNGKPKTRRRATVELNGGDSSSQSSSDELRELEVRHKPSKSKKSRNQKRSVSDPFPPQSVNGRRNAQPQTTQLDPREELMIAIRNSGGLNTLRQVHTDEIKWSAQV